MDHRWDIGLENLILNRRKVAKQELQGAVYGSLGFEAWRNSTKDG